MAPEPPIAGEDVAVVLDRVRSELADLHATVLGLQRALGPTLIAAAGCDDVLRAGQKLDLVAQSLDGLAVFLGALSRDGLASGRLNSASAAAACVRLDGLSSRLAGRATPTSGGDRGGDLELF